jgi:hypothetical protein
MPKSGKRRSTKRVQQRAKRERAELRMVRRSVEQQMRLAYSKVPQDAAALSQARLNVRAGLVSSGYLTVEELESLGKKEAIATAMRHINQQMRSEQTE